MIREGDWKLIQFFEDDSVKLFNLKNDIGEKSDLSTSEPDRAAAMLAKLKAWQEKTKAPIPSELNPDFGKQKAAAGGKKKGGKRKKSTKAE